MAHELVYTSAEKGLRPGTSGFCTVAMTRGLPAALVPRLEALGGYRPGPSGNGPEAFCFWRIETSSGIAHVLSVVGPAPPDHTARTNKIATYLVLAPDELSAEGPAAMIGREGLLRRSWSGSPAWIEQPVHVPHRPGRAQGPCVAWEAACGDAGWAGVAASAFLRDQSRPIHVIYRAETDPLPLVEEVIGLLPDWARWRATFSTYFLQPVAGTPCCLRFCLDGTAAAESARQSKSLVIDLARPTGIAPESRFARRARTGIDEDPVARKPRARAAAGEAIELEPDTDPPARVDLAAGARRAVVPPAGPRASGDAGGLVTPARIAIVAGILTVLVLAVILVIAATAGGQETPSVSPPSSRDPVGAAPARAGSARLLARRRHGGRNATRTKATT